MPKETLFFPQTEKISYPHKKASLRSAIGFLFKSVTGLVKTILCMQSISHNIATLHEGFVENKKFKNKSVQYSPVMGLFQ